MKRLGLIFLKVFFLIQCLGSSAHAQTLNPPGNLRLGGTVAVPPSTAAVPLSWNDPAFANTATSSCVTISDGQTRSNLSMVSTGGDACTGFVGSGTLNNSRINAREGPRVQRGQVNLNWVWIEVWANLAAGDHADGLQCYGPGNTGTVTVKNTTFYVKGGAHTGYFSADDWRGSHVFENVLFWGDGTGQFGLRIPYDGGTGVSLKNVYFVKGSVGTPFQFDAIGGRRIPILQWDNVRWATVQDGKLVPGDLIPRP